MIPAAPAPDKVAGSFIPPTNGKLRVMQKMKKGEIMKKHADSTEHPVCVLTDWKDGSLPSVTP